MEEKQNVELINKSKIWCLGEKNKIDKLWNKSRAKKGKITIYNIRNNTREMKKQLKEY